MAFQNKHAYTYIYIYIYIYHYIMHMVSCISLSIYIWYLHPLKPTFFFTYSSHGWVKRGLPYIQAYFEEKMAIVSRGGAVYVNIVV